MKINIKITFFLASVLASFAISFAAKDDKKKPDILNKDKWNEKYEESKDKYQKNVKKSDAKDDDADDGVREMKSKKFPKREPKQNELIEESIGDILDMDVLTRQQWRWFFQGFLEWFRACTDDGVRDIDLIKRRYNVISLKVAVELADILDEVGVESDIADVEKLVKEYFNMKDMGASMKKKLKGMKKSDQTLVKLKGGKDAKGKDANLGDKKGKDAKSKSANLQNDGKEDDDDADDEKDSKTDATKEPDAEDKPDATKKPDAKKKKKKSKSKDDAKSKYEENKKKSEKKMEENKEKARDKNDKMKNASKKGR